MTDTLAQSAAPACPCCTGPTHLVRQIDLKGMPDIYVYYCASCQFVETLKKDRAA